MDGSDGVGSLSYEEKLRAIGHLIDEQGWQAICLMEIPEGLLMRGLGAGTRLPDGLPVSETRLVEPARMAGLVAVARQRRRAGGAPHPAAFAGPSDGRRPAAHRAPPGPPALRAGTSGTGPLAPGESGIDPS